MHLTLTLTLTYSRLLPVTAFILILVCSHTAKARYRDEARRDLYETIYREVRGECIGGDAEKSASDLLDLEERQASGTSSARSIVVVRFSAAGE